MSEIVKKFGQRVKHYRTKMGVSQEKFAEMCGLHPTYIGQVERGEKNCTLESAEKISLGLGIPLENLVCRIAPVGGNPIPDEIYELLISMDEKNQQNIYSIIKTILKMTE